MDDLFRFLTIRPPQAPDAQGLDITTQSAYQNRLAAYRQESRSRAWANYVALTANQSASQAFVLSVDRLSYPAAYDALRRSLTPVPAQMDSPALDALIAQAFGKNATALSGDANFSNDTAMVFDSIVVRFIQPPADSNGTTTLSQLVAIAQVIGVIRMAMAVAKQAVDVDTVAAALNASLVLPSAIFPVASDVIHPVGVADLLVVKQHIARYELGEISSLENLLRGESRELTHKHSLTTEQTTTTDSSTTTETSNELTTDERFALHREAASTTNEDTSVKGGLSVSAKYGTTLQVNANAEAAYKNSKTDATKNASDYAKDVTMRAATKVTQTFRQTIVSRVLETLEDQAGRKLDNAGGANLTGVYQWVDKIYLSQVYNYGKRLQYDMVVPEPAALLLDAAKAGGKAQLPPVPDDFVLTPADLSTVPGAPNYYGAFLAKYGVADVTPPPLDTVTASKTFTLTSDDKTMDKASEVPVPDGYQAIHVWVRGNYNYSDSTNGLNVFVGDQTFAYVKQQATTPLDQPLTNLEAKSIPVAIEVYGVSDYAVSVEIRCQPMAATWDAWRLKTHGSIVSAWRQRQNDYQAALAKQNMKAGDSLPLGADNVEINRKIEQRELKRCVIQMLYNPNLDVSDVTTGPQNIPQPDPAKAAQDGKVVRFFEQVFEWENMMYVFYPYFWGRRTTWYDKALAQNADPLFADFLNAGAARLVLPVRPTFEGLLRYFLLTGQIWGGGDMPDITDPTYLPITEEIKELQGAPGSETPQGPPWEVRIPTSLIKLRGDGSRPTWDRSSGLAPIQTADWDWQPTPKDAW